MFYNSDVTKKRSSLCRVVLAGLQSGPGGMIGKGAFLSRSWNLRISVFEELGGCLND